MFSPNSSGMLLCRPIVRAAVTGAESTITLTPTQLEDLWKLLLAHLLRNTGVYEEDVSKTK